MASDGFRNARLVAYRTASEWGWMTKTLVAAGFAGGLALLSQLSIPVPWTPVPLTMQVLGVYLIGTYLGTRYALASMGIYLAAGALGLHVFAPSADAYNPGELWSGERWKVLVPDTVHHTGSTAGYIVGWVLAAAFVAAWMRRREARLDSRFLWAAIVGLASLLVLMALAAVYLAEGSHFAKYGGAGDQYDSGLDLVLIFVAAAVVSLPLVAWLLWRGRGGSEAVNLYVVLLAATAIIHVPGVLVLMAVKGYSLQKAAALGSTVFLPFDGLKAGAAVALSLPFLPRRDELGRADQDSKAPGE